MKLQQYELWSTTVICNLFVCLSEPQDREVFVLYYEFCLFFILRNKGRLQASMTLGMEEGSSFLK
jgi:hypothetical protein